MLYTNSHLLELTGFEAQFASNPTARNINSPPRKEATKISPSSMISTSAEDHPVDEEVSRFEQLRDTSIAEISSALSVRTVPDRFCSLVSVRCYRKLIMGLKLFLEASRMHIFEDEVFLRKSLEESPFANLVDLPENIPRVVDRKIPTRRLRSIVSHVFGGDPAARNHKLLSAAVRGVSAADKLLYHKYTRKPMQRDLPEEIYIRDLSGLSIEDDSDLVCTEAIQLQKEEEDEDFHVCATRLKWAKSLIPSALGDAPGLGYYRFSEEKGADSSEWTPYGLVPDGRKHRLVGPESLDSPQLRSECDHVSYSYRDLHKLEILFPEPRAALIQEGRVLEGQRYYLRVKTSYISRNTLASLLLILMRQRFGFWQGYVTGHNDDASLARIMHWCPEIFWNVLLRVPGLLFHSGGVPIGWTRAIALLVSELLCRVVPQVVAKTTAALGDRPVNGLELQSCPVKFRTAVACRKLFAKEEICLYSGDILTGSTSLAIRETAQGIIELFTNSSYIFYLGKQTCVDGSAETLCFSRLINHSRKNSNITAQSAKCSKCGITQLQYVVKRDIEQGHEVLINYGETRRKVLMQNKWLLE